MDGIYDLKTAKNLLSTIIIHYQVLGVIKSTISPWLDRLKIELYLDFSAQLLLYITTFFDYTVLIIFVFAHDLIA